MFEVRFSAVTGSTNDDAAALLGEPAGGGLVLQADYQRAGRGRRSRAWLAPPGSALLCTAILPEPVTTAALWAVPFWTALGLAAGIERAGGLRPALQWPNDLLLGGAKVAGILCVSRVVGERAWVGCGLGLNVRRPPSVDDGAFAELLPPPAFLDDAAPDIRRERLLAAILDAFARNLGALADPDHVARTWETRAGLAGTSYRILVDGDAEPFDARALRLAGDGSLVVWAEHAERRVSLGDARILRASPAGGG